MNKKYIILIITLVIIFFALILTMRQQVPAYSLTLNESLQDAKDNGNVLMPADVVNIINNSGEKRHVFIDVRNSYDYVKGHLTGAANMPSGSILSDENQKIFRRLNEAKVDVILYGNTQSEANAPWMLLRQMGYGNVKIMAGGYPTYVAFMNHDSTGMASFKPAEAAMLDYAAAMRADTSSAVPKKPVVKKTVKLAPVAKEKAAEGGC